jgi:hypothetical protein
VVPVSEAPQMLCERVFTGRYDPKVDVLHRGHPPRREEVFIIDGACRTRY